MVRILTLLNLIFCLVTGIALPARVQNNGRHVSLEVYESLEELARLVDITYCVGTTGVHKPFQCLSRCHEFEGFELITTWNTGPLLSDSCGYIAVSHPPFNKRIIVAFRGTYSIASTVVDLSTNPAQYMPFPDDSDGNTLCEKDLDSTPSEPLLPQIFHSTHNSKRSLLTTCTNCTVHTGFLTSWRNTRCTILPHVEHALKTHPDYELVLVGHSLGGAVAALAALEFQARGWSPQVTTFGEPRLGNAAFNRFIDTRFNLGAGSPDTALYRRVTHVNDPVPLLPLEEWGYKMHAGEIFISKSSLPPSQSDLRHCFGDQDPACIEGGGSDSWSTAIKENTNAKKEMVSTNDEDPTRETIWPIPPRYQLWHLFTAHRNYFWRLGLCVPGGYPWDWAGSDYGHVQENGLQDGISEEL